MSRHDIRPDVTLSPPADPLLWRSVDLSLSWKRLKDEQAKAKRTRVRVEATRGGLAVACVLAWALVALLVGGCAEEKAAATAAVVPAKKLPVRITMELNPDMLCGASVKDGLYNTVQVSLRDDKGNIVIAALAKETADDVIAVCRQEQERKAWRPLMPKREDDHGVSAWSTFTLRHHPHRYGPDNPHHICCGNACAANSYCPEGAR